MSVWYASRAWNNFRSRAILFFGDYFFSTVITMTMTMLFSPHSVFHIDIRVILAWISLRSMRCLSWYIHLLLGLRIDCISRGGSEHSLALWGKTLRPLHFEFVLVFTLDIVGLVCVCVHSVYYLVRGEVHWTGVSYIQMIGTTHFVLFLYLAVF